MDCRKDLRVDQSQSPTGSRLRTLYRNRCSIRPPRHDPHHAQAACCKHLVMNLNFPDRLSENQAPNKEPHPIHSNLRSFNPVSDGQFAKLPLRCARCSKSISVKTSTIMTRRSLFYSSSLDSWSRQNAASTLLRRMIWPKPAVLPCPLYRRFRYISRRNVSIAERRGGDSG